MIKTDEVSEQGCMCNEIALADRVQIVSNDQYAERADGRLGGVGWEIMLISGDLLTRSALGIMSSANPCRQHSTQFLIEEYFVGTHDVLYPASLPLSYTADDAGAQHISSGAGVETTPTWPINLTMPRKRRTIVHQLIRQRGDLCRPQVQPWRALIDLDNPKLAHFHPLLPRSGWRLESGIPPLVGKVTL
jgi:hypothetical protein